MKERKASIQQQRARWTAADRAESARRPGKGTVVPVRKEDDTRPPPTTSPPETGRHELPRQLRHGAEMPKPEPVESVTASRKRRRPAALRLRLR